VEDVSSETDTRLGKEYLIVALLAAILFYISVAPGALWQDSGLIQVRVLKHDYYGRFGLALAHPLFYMVAQPFQLLPFHDSAFKTNLVSATCAVFAVANVYLLLSWMFVGRDHRRSVACLGGLSVGLAHTFWQHASVAEVHSLAAMILTTELLLLYKFSQTFQLRWYLGAWFLNGLECSNHVLALLGLAGVLIWSIILIRKKVFPAHWLILAVACWMIGSLPYEYLGYRVWSAGVPLGEVFHSMLFGNFRAKVLNVHVTPRLLFMSAAFILLNFPTLNILLIPVGVVKARKLGQGRFISLLGWITAFHLLFAVRYNVPDQYTFFVLPVLLLSIWLALGGAFLLEKYHRFSYLRWLTIVFALVPVVFYAPLPRVAKDMGVDLGYRAPIPYRDEGKYFLWPWKTGYRGPERLVREAFNLAGPRAIILADGTSRRPFIYYQLFENLRADVRIRFDPCRREEPENKVRCLKELLKRREVYVVRPFRAYCPQWILDNFQIEPAGPIYRVRQVRPTTQTAPENAG